MMVSHGKDYLLTISISVDGSEWLVNINVDDDFE